MTAARDQIKSIIERVERMDEGIKDFNDDKKEIFAEAKANGLDVPALKTVIRRRRDPDKTAEIDAMIDLYESALGINYAPTRAATHEAA